MTVPVTRIPSSWPHYGIVWRFARTRYEIAVSNPECRCRGISEAELDGEAVDPHVIPLVDDGATHTVQLVLGAQTGLVPPVANLGAIAQA